MPLANNMLSRGPLLSHTIKILMQEFIIKHIKSSLCHRRAKGVAASSNDVCFQAFPHGRAHSQFVGTLKAKVPVVGDEHNSSKMGIVLKNNFESKDCTLYAPRYLVALCSPRGDWDSPKALG